MNYCESHYAFKRRVTRDVVVGDPARGGVIIGGRHPVVMQSMITCDTMDTAASVQQTLDLGNINVRAADYAVKYARALNMNEDHIGRVLAQRRRGDLGKADRGGI